MGSKDGHPRFREILDELWKLHTSKRADYGAENDPLANVRAAQEFGLPAWLGAGLRMNDKLHRIKVYAQKGELVNDSIEDDLLDLASYAIIALILLEEGK